MPTEQEPGLRDPGPIITFRGFWLPVLVILAMAAFVVFVGS